MAHGQIRALEETLERSNSPNQTMAAMQRSQEDGNSLNKPAPMAEVTPTTRSTADDDSGPDWTEAWLRRTEGCATMEAAASTA